MKRIEAFIEKCCGIKVSLTRCDWYLYDVQVGSKNFQCQVEVNPLDMELKTDKDGKPIFKVQTCSFGMVSSGSDGANAVAVQNFLLTDINVKEMFINLTDMSVR